MSVEGLITPLDGQLEPTMTRIDAMLTEHLKDGSAPRRLLICRRAFDSLNRELRARDLAWKGGRHLATPDQVWEAAHQGMVYVKGLRLVPCEDCYLFVPTEGSGQ